MLAEKDKELNRLSNDLSNAESRIRELEFLI